MTFAGLSVSVSTVAEGAALLFFWVESAIVLMLMDECVVSMRKKSKKQGEEIDTFHAGISAYDARSHVISFEGNEVKPRSTIFNKHSLHESLTPS